jgi:luciferase family oxidoreductase group 1
MLVSNMVQPSSLSVVVPGATMRTRAPCTATTCPARSLQVLRSSSRPSTCTWPAAIKAHPQGPTCPEIWILGSSDYGAQLAAHFGLPYAFAYFFADGQGTETALRLYRELYKPSPRHPVPQATLCVWALVADSDEEALHHAGSRERWRVDRMRGVFGALQAPDDVAARGFTAEELPTVEAMRRKAFVGSAAKVGAMLRALAAQFALDEIVVNTWAHDPAMRRHSYALLAREFALA